MSNFAPDNLLQTQPSGTSGNPASDNRKPRNNAALIFVLVLHVHVTHVRNRLQCANPK